MSSTNLAIRQRDLPTGNEPPAAGRTDAGQPGRGPGYSYVRRRQIMPSTTDISLVGAVSRSARVLRGVHEDYEPIIDESRGMRYVLLGEASHGTHEFYRERAEITKRLITEQEFTAVTVEADWPDASRVNRYVRGVSDDATAVEALGGFKRFPQWMWRNTVVVEFVEWLRAHNAALPADAPKTSFYGMDLYSLHASMEAVLRYLETVDPALAERARGRYACFDHFGPDVQSYGWLTGAGVSEGCREGVVSVLLELQRRASEYARRDDRALNEAFFNAEQNARLVMNAEAYYRSMFLSDVSSWNLRDTHMVETLEAVAAHLQRREQRAARIVVWAHNSHLGDARATEMSRRGELNVGQLVRMQYGDAALLIGFSTHHGTVTAATDWEGPAERKRVRPALAGSYESAFHESEIPRFLLRSRNAGVAEALADERLERAIGVIYRPQTERQSHYFNARLRDQFDCVIHFDETRAVEPLEPSAEWEGGEPPETFPFGV
jgi:erythromycin esterase-like protein